MNSETASTATPDKRLLALDAAIERGLADEAAGRVKPAEEVFDRLEAKYAKLMDAEKSRYDSEG